MRCSETPGTGRGRIWTGPARARLLLWLALLATAGCSRTTATLSSDQESRLTSEGVLRRGEDLLFRYSHDLGAARSGWEDRVASIVVTGQTVLIHDNTRVLLEITPRSTGEYRVARERDRLSLGAGNGASRRSWSFRPPEDADGWTQDIRAVIRGTAGSRRSRQR